MAHQFVHVGEDLRDGAIEFLWDGLADIRGLIDMLAPIMDTPMDRAVAK